MKTKRRVCNFGTTFEILLAAFCGYFVYQCILTRDWLHIIPWIGSYLLACYCAAWCYKMGDQRDETPRLRPQVRK